MGDLSLNVPVTRHASCGCGSLTAECVGPPGRVSVCHCLACQQRTGGAFSAQLRFPVEAVRLTGERRDWTRIGDTGGRATFSFCPTCGATIAYVIDALPGVVAIPLGAFADPTLPPPRFSVYEDTAHPWVRIEADGIERHP